MFQHFFLWLGPKKIKKLILTVINRQDNKEIKTLHTFEVVTDQFVAQGKLYDAIFFGKKKPKKTNIFPILLFGSHISRIQGTLQLIDGKLHYVHHGSAPVYLNNEKITGEKLVVVPHNSRLLLGNLGPETPPQAQLHIQY